MPKLEIKTDENQIDWLWAVLQVTSEVPLLVSTLLGYPFQAMGLFAKNNGGNIEFRAVYKPVKQVEDGKPPLPESFRERYMRPHLKRPDEVLSSSARVQERGDKTIVIEPSYKITKDGTVFLPRDPQHPEEITSSIFVSEGDIIVTQGTDGTQNIPLSTRSDLEGRVGQINGLLANYTAALWQESGRNNNNLTLEWQFPTTVDQRTMIQAREKYITSQEIAGRKHRSRDFVLEWENVGGLSRPRKTLEGMITDIENPSLSERAGTSPYGEKIFVLSGDSESGRTSLIRATATELQKRVAKKEKGGFTFYYFDCVSSLQEYGRFIGDELNAVIRAAQNDVKEGRTALLHVDNLDALFMTPETTDPEVARRGLIEASQRIGAVRDAIRNVYRFHTEMVADYLAEFQKRARRSGQLRRYKIELAEEENREWGELEERARSLREQNVGLGEDERERLRELRYRGHGLSEKEEKELERLSRELENPYLPTLVIIAESTYSKSQLGTLSDVIRREIKVYNDTEDRVGIFKTLIGTADYTLGRSRDPMVKFEGIDYQQLARATEGMPVGTLKELHLDVMTETKLQIRDTGQPQVITTETYLSKIQSERNYLAKTGELRRPIGLEPHRRAQQ